MDQKLKTVSKKLICDECKNEFGLEDKKEGDVVECPMCGMEYEVMLIDSDGEMELTVLEDEK
ncbi:lysine biosynthesis protein LysW [Candidatus Dojkabacteria bacterium]|nr:lysine biosynthesis protein LysW [Candidatus Dojkabacteria bacterium]